MAKVDIDADWQARATSAAIQACKEVTGPGVINPRATISSLSDVEWGWIASAAIFAWIATKSKHAVADGTDFEASVRAMHNQEPAPWDAGAIETILPTLGQMTLPWSNAIGSWPKGQMIKFCHRIHQLADEALKSRDKGSIDRLTARLSQTEMEREASATAGGGLLAAGELEEADPNNANPTVGRAPHPHDGKLNDDIPF